MEGKELSRFPRPLSENYNSGLIERLYESGGSVALDLIVYLANHQMKNLFGESWFSINDFCDTMGYDRTKLHRKLSEEQIRNLFGKRTPRYVRQEADGSEIVHPIETVFEAAIYRLGIENLAFPTKNSDGSTSYNFVQIITKFDIKTDFKTKKGTKRLYNVVLNDTIKDSLFTQYNLIELRDYRKIPDRKGYRYFYLNLSKMIYLIKYKINQGQSPYFTLSVDQLATIFDIQIEKNSDRKKKVKTILDSINKSLQVTRFQFDFVTGEKEKWAYTIQFYFPEDTLQYFDEKFDAVFTKRFHSDLLWLYVSEKYPNSVGVGRDNKISEIKNNPELYNEFMQWMYSSDDGILLKEKTYRDAFISVFQRTPEELGIELFKFSK